jgi:hypothetical protein
MDIGVILKQFEAPDEVGEMVLGRFEVVRVGARPLGSAWRRLTAVRRPPLSSTCLPLPTTGCSSLPGRRRNWNCCMRG